MIKARVEWDGYNWVAFPEGGGSTFAKRLDQLPSLVTEVVELMTGESVPPDDVELDIAYGQWGPTAAEIRVLRKEVAELEETLARRTAEVVQTLRAQGLSLRDIGMLLGISYQRAHQLLSETRAPVA